MGNSISVVIPVYNSQASLDELYAELSSVLQQITDKYEIVLVNDGSIDNSYDKMIALYHRDSNIKIIQLDGNFGQQNALLCGFYFVAGDYVVTLDDDMQHPPEEIVKLLSKIQEGYDIVYGIPAKKRHSFYRNLGTKLTDYLFDKFCSKPKYIKVSSFRIMKKALVEKIIQDKTSFVYLSAITFKNTRNVGNVIVNHSCRKYGKSNYNLLKLVKQFVKLYVYYSSYSIFKIFISSRPQFIIKDKHL
jgi:undecaprenyl-phosphate 4-deoxy-4-formamido-L-arabinose transferase